MATYIPGSGKCVITCNEEEEKKEYDVHIRLHFDVLSYPFLSDFGLSLSKLYIPRNEMTYYIPADMNMS